MIQFTTAEQAKEFVALGWAAVDTHAYLKARQHYCWSMYENIDTAPRIENLYTSSQVGTVYAETYKRLGPAFTVQQFVDALTPRYDITIEIVQGSCSVTITNTWCPPRQFSVYGRSYLLPEAFGNAIITALKAKWLTFDQIFAK